MESVPLSSQNTVEFTASLSFSQHNRFALWKRTRHTLVLAFDYRMQAELVITTIKMVPFEVPGAISHSDQGKQYGAAQTRTLLLEKGFDRSMSRVGTPTDNGYAERFVGLFKLAVAERQPYRTLGDFLRTAQQWVNFYDTTRLHKSLDCRSPDQYAQEETSPRMVYTSWQ
jgi:putative transposase